MRHQSVSSPCHRVYSSNSSFYNAAACNERKSPATDEPEVAEVQCQLSIRVGHWGGNAPYLCVALPEPKSGACMSVCQQCWSPLCA